MSGDRVVAVWEQKVDGTLRVFSSYSSDSGDTWNTNRLIEDNAGFTAAYPRVVISGSNAVAIWQQEDGTYNSIYSNYSTNWGAAWGQAQLVENEDYQAWDACVAIDGTKVVAAWSQADSAVVYALDSNYSTDGGKTWEGVKQVSYDGISDRCVPQIAISGANVAMVWFQEGWFGGRIHGITSTDAGANWGEEQLIEDNIDCVGLDPQVAMYGLKVVAVWYQTDGPDYSDYNFHVYGNYTVFKGISGEYVVGGQVAPVNKQDIVSPWLILTLALTGGIALFSIRRRKTG